MVFGNMGDDSGHRRGVHARPEHGRARFYGEFLVNAQGEDVVAGIRTPLEIDQMARGCRGVHGAAADAGTRLERHYHDMQDIEFTVERGTLYLLQTRTGKRTAPAALRIAPTWCARG
jgi:pyruvate, orthophosphate dikinase